MLCKDCGRETEQKRFATYRTRSGEERRRNVCWDCRSQYQQENAERLKEYRKEYNKKNKSKRDLRSAKRRAEIKKYVDEQKNVPCADCGQKWPPVAMDFDHVRGVKHRSISQLYAGAYKLDLIKEEIAKCEVVCACCHRVRTWMRGDNHTPKRTNHLPKIRVT